MTKAELAKAVYESNPGDFESKAAASRAVNSMLDAITGSLKEKEAVTLVGFGTFSVVRRAERQGRNVRTNEPITIPAHNVVKFKPGSALSEAVV